MPKKEKNEQKKEKWAKKKKNKSMNQKWFNIHHFIFVGIITSNKYEAMDFFMNQQFLRHIMIGFILSLFFKFFILNFAHYTVY